MTNAAPMSTTPPIRFELNSAATLSIASRAIAVVDSEVDVSQRLQLLIDELELLARELASLHVVKPGRPDH